MKTVSFEELVEKVCDLSIGGKLYVKPGTDGETFGIACLGLFDSDLLVMSHLGGGFSSMFDTSVENEREGVPGWLRHGLGCDGMKEIYLLDMEEPEIDTAAPDYGERIISLRRDIISSIISVMKENGLETVSLSGNVDEPQSVLWCDGDGNWYDTPVASVSLTEKGISLFVKDECECVDATLENDNFEIAFDNPCWLSGILDNVTEAVEYLNNACEQP